MQTTEMLSKRLRTPSLKSGCLMLMQMRWAWRRPSSCGHLIIELDNNQVP